MNENTKQVLALLGDIAILSNKGDRARWGVLFNTIKTKEGDIDEAFVLARSPECDKTSLIVRVSEFGKFEYDKNAPFYHYEEEGFMRNQLLPITPEYLHEKISSFNFVQPIRIPYGNFINIIHREFPERSARSRVRVIIKAEHGQIDKDYILCKFDEDGIFNHPKAPKPFYIDKYSRLGRDDVKPGKIYVCQVTNEKSDCFLVNVLKEYFKGVGVALYETVGGGYFPESDEELYNFDYYKETRVLKVPFILPGDYVFDAIHLDCNLVMDCLKLLNGFKWIDLVVNPSSNHPVLITGVREDETYPKIECFLGPLNKAVRGSRR